MSNKDNPVPLIAKIYADIKISHPHLTSKEVKQFIKEIEQTLHNLNYGDLKYNISVKANGVETEKN